MPTFIFGCVLMSLGEIYALLADWQLYNFKKKQIENFLNSEFNSNASNKSLVYDAVLFKYYRFPNF